MFRRLFLGGQNDLPHTASMRIEARIEQINLGLLLFVSHRERLAECRFDNLAVMRRAHVTQGDGMNHGLLQDGYCGLHNHFGRA